MLKYLSQLFFGITFCGWTIGFVEPGQIHFPQQTTRYDNYSLLRFTWPHISNQLPTLRTLALNWDTKGELDIWKKSVKDGTFELDVLVSPKAKLRAIKSIESSVNITVSIVVDNIQDRFDAEYQHSVNVRTHEQMTTSIGYFDDFRTLEEINARLHEYAKAYPELVTLITLEESFEGRAIEGVVITGPGKDKPEIWVNGGIHAREWLSPPTVMWLIETFLLRYNSPLYPEVKKIVDGFLWTIIPVLNPDGFEYTWRSNRNWRKTRKPNVGSSCIGTDPNRNFGSHWGEVGVSKDPCSDIYCGTKAFDNPEVEAVGNFFRTHTKLVGTLDVHTCGQMLLSPWGWTFDLPADWDKLEPYLEKFCSAIEESFDTEWSCGPISTTIYPDSGSTSDYAYDAFGIYNSYAPELRCDSNASSIPLSGHEIWNGVSVWAQLLLQQVHTQGIQSLRGKKKKS